MPRNKRKYFSSNGSVRMPNKCSAWWINNPLLTNSTSITRSFWLNGTSLSKRRLSSKSWLSKKLNASSAIDFGLKTYRPSRCSKMYTRSFRLWGWSSKLKKWGTRFAIGYQTSSKRDCASSRLIWCVSESRLKIWPGRKLSKSLGCKDGKEIQSLFWASLCRFKR